MGRSFVGVEWVKHQVVNNVTDLISFWVVVGQVDASQRKASLESDSPPRDRMAAADGKTKMYAVEMHREALLEQDPGTISRPGLLGFSVPAETSAVEWSKIAVTIWISAAVGLLSELLISMATTAAAKQVNVLSRPRMSDGSLLEKYIFQHQHQQCQGHYHRRRPLSWQPMKDMSMEEVDQSRWRDS